MDTNDTNVIVGNKNSNQKKSKREITEISKSRGISIASSESDRSNDIDNNDNNTSNKSGRRRYSSTNEIVDAVFGTADQQVDSDSIFFEEQLHENLEEHRINIQEVNSEDIHPQIENINFISNKAYESFGPSNHEDIRKDSNYMFQQDETDPSYNDNSSKIYDDIRLEENLHMNDRNRYQRLVLESHNFEQEESEIWRVYDMKRRKKFGNIGRSCAPNVSVALPDDINTKDISFLNEKEDEEEDRGGVSQLGDRRDSSGGLLLHHRYLNSSNSIENNNNVMNNTNEEFAKKMEYESHSSGREKKGNSRRKWNYSCDSIRQKLNYFLQYFYHNICLCGFYNRYMTKNKERAFKRWILTLIVALGIQLVAVCIIYLTTTIVSFKYWTITSCLDYVRFKGENTSMVERVGYILLGFILYILICIFFSIIAFTMCYIEPATIGSGIPETKSYLNGIDLPNILEGKTLLCKALGIACSIVSGLPVGKEGPLIQIGAIVGATVTRGFCKCGTREEGTEEEKEEGSEEEEEEDSGEKSKLNTSNIHLSNRSIKFNMEDATNIKDSKHRQDKNDKDKRGKRRSKKMANDNSTTSSSLEEDVEGNGVELQIRERNEKAVKGRIGKGVTNSEEGEEEEENGLQNESDMSVLSLKIPSFSSTSSSPRKENLGTSTLNLSQNFADYLSKASSSLLFSPSSSSPPRHHRLRSSDPSIDVTSSLHRERSRSSNNLQKYTESQTRKTGVENSNIPVYYLEQNNLSYNDGRDVSTWFPHLFQTLQSLCSLEDFRNHKEIREFVVCGAAAGVTAAFGAPLGGMLFAMEEGASYWSLKLSWRVFACSVATAIVGLILVDIIRSSPLSAIVDPKAVIAQLNYFGFFPPGMLWTFRDMFIFVVMGVFGGVLGALFNGCNLFITRLRKNYLYPKYYLKEELLEKSDEYNNYVVRNNLQNNLRLSSPISKDDKKSLDFSLPRKKKLNFKRHMLSLPSKISAMTGDWKKSYRFQFWEVIILTSIMASLCYCIPLMNRDVCQPYPAVIPLATQTEEVTNLLVPFTCYKPSNATTSQDKGSFNTIASLYFTSWDDSLRLLIHMPMYSVVELGDEGGETVIGKISNRPLFTVDDLLLFVLPYFIMTFLTFGIMVPSGLFIPSLVSGAAFGRIIGQVLHTSYGANKFAAPGVYALMGASALLGGITRIYISLSVILLETTGNLYFLFPFMVVLMTARFVGNSINDGIYDMHIHLRKYPFLEPWCPLEAKVNDLRASDVMASPVITIRPIECVARLVQILEKCNHHAFPLLEKHGGIFGIINRDTLCVLLHLQAFSVSYSSAQGLKKEESFPTSNNVANLEPPHDTKKTIIETQSNYHSGPAIDFDSPLPQSPIIPYEWIEAYFPDYPTIDQIKSKLNQSFSSSSVLETLEQCYIDLRPYCNTAPYFISESCTLTRTYRLFRTMGMRHLLVMSNIHSNELVGIITRHDLVEYKLSNIIRKKQNSVDALFENYEHLHMNKQKNYYENNGDVIDVAKINSNTPGISTLKDVKGSTELSSALVSPSNKSADVKLERSESGSSQKSQSELPSSLDFQTSRRRSSLLEALFNRVSRCSNSHSENHNDPEYDSTSKRSSEFRPGGRVWRLDMNMMTRFHAVGRDNINTIKNIRSSISTFSPPRLLHFRRSSTKAIEAHEKEVWIEGVKNDWEDVTIDEDIGELNLESYSKIHQKLKVAKDVIKEGRTKSRSRSNSPKGRKHHKR